MTSHAWPEPMMSRLTGAKMVACQRFLDRINRITLYIYMYTSTSYNRHKSLQLRSIYIFICIYIYISVYKIMYTYIHAHHAHRWLASDCLTTVKYRRISQVWRHHYEIGISLVTWPWPSDRCPFSLSLCLRVFLALVRQFSLCLTAYQLISITYCVIHK